MIQLSQTQSDILVAAANADEGSIPIPVEAKNSAAGLVKRGLALAIPHSNGSTHLLITTSGRAAIGWTAPTTDKVIPLLGQQGADGDQDLPELAPPSKPSGGKIATLIKLLRQPGGAVIGEMMEATGWQAHSVRGALSGSIKRDKGLNVTSQKVDERRIYRITDNAAA